jgi:hypothetical protein
MKRRNRLNEQFSARYISMLESPAFRVLSRGAHQFLTRLEIELAHHGGNDNGRLPLTYQDLIDYGMSRNQTYPSTTATSSSPPAAASACIERRSTSPPCLPANASASRRSTTEFGSSALCATISDTSIWSREPCSPSTTRSARGCYPCLRYVLSPMCSGRSSSKPTDRAPACKQKEKPRKAMSVPLAVPGERAIQCSVSVSTRFWTCRCCCGLNNLCRARIPSPATSYAGRYGGPPKPRQKSSVNVI